MSTSQETLHSFLRLYAEKEGRDFEAKVRFHSEEARIHREHAQCLRNSRKTFTDAVGALLNMSTTTPTRLSTGRQSPEGTITAEVTQDEDLLQIGGNSGRQSSNQRRPIYAMDIVHESGLAASNVRQQDPTHLMVPMSTQSSQHHEFGSGIPAQIRPSILGTGIDQRKESINQVLSTTDRLLDTQAPPQKRARFESQQHRRQQTSWSPATHIQFHQGLPEANFQRFSFPDGCLCSMPSPSERLFCRRCQKMYGQCFCQHEQLLPWCTSCRKIADCFCWECTPAFFPGV